MVVNIELTKKVGTQQPPSYRYEIGERKCLHSSCTCTTFKSESGSTWPAALGMLENTAGRHPVRVRERERKNTKKMNSLSYSSIRNFSFQLECKYSSAIIIIYFGVIKIIIIIYAFLCSHLLLLFMFSFSLSPSYLFISFSLSPSRPASTPLPFTSPPFLSLLGSFVLSCLHEIMWCVYI